MRHEGQTALPYPTPVPHVRRTYLQVERLEDRVSPTTLKLGADALLADPLEPATRDPYWETPLPALPPLSGALRDTEPGTKPDHGLELTSWLGPAAPRAAHVAVTPSVSLQAPPDRDADLLLASLSGTGFS
jgi:hypothetical protein